MGCLIELSFFWREAPLWETERAGDVCRMFCLGDGGSVLMLGYLGEEA